MLRAMFLLVRLVLLGVVERKGLESGVWCLESTNGENMASKFLFMAFYQTKRTMERVVGFFIMHLFKEIIYS